MIPKLWDSSGLRAGFFVGGGWGWRHVMPFSYMGGGGILERKRNSLCAFEGSEQINRHLGRDYRNGSQCHQCN